jgi:nucleoside phosphorylase
MTHEADVLIVTVTKVESHAVIQAFKQVAGHKATPQSIDYRTYFNLGTVNGARVFLTQSEMGSGGLGASLLTVGKGIEALSPAAVIMVGIAFGINEQKQAIGDILVSEQLRLYDLQRMGTQNGQPHIILRGDKPHASHWLINHFKSADLLWNGAKVRFGVVLTGEKLVDNVDFRDELHSFESEAIGGEMEGAGLYVACQDKKVDWILVKAICDWADGNKAQDKDARQQTAAQNAAAFVLEGLQFAPIDWQQRQRKAANAAQSLKLTGVMTDRETVAEILIAHQKALTLLELQAASYTTTTIPVYLKLQLDEKREEVAKWKKKLEEAQ